MRSSISLVFLLLIACSGCSTLSRAGFGDRGTFNDGVLTTRFDQDIGVTYEVAVKALADLDVVVLNAAKQESQALIEAARPLDRAPIVIAFIWRRNDTTGATIKVGKNGDEPYSRTIVDAVNERLKEWHLRNDPRDADPGRPATQY